MDAEYRQQCARVGIRSAEGLHLAKVQAFDYLLHAFPRGGLPTDVDGVVEVKRRYLLLEYKPQGVLLEQPLGVLPRKTGSMSMGQYWAFMGFVRWKVLTVVVVGYDELGEPHKAQLWVRDHSAPEEVRKTNLEFGHGRHSLWYLCSMWSSWADPTYTRPFIADMPACDLPPISFAPTYT
jgi:hypothetical protein